MKIAFFDTKPYDRTWFDFYAKDYEAELFYVEERLSPQTVKEAEGCAAVCIFVNDDCSGQVVAQLAKLGVKAILLRCAGYNNVDLKAAEECGIPVLRVPSYSPSAVAEHAAALLLAVNRKIPRAYCRTRDFNFSIHGLMGIGLEGKQAGIIGTGKIGQSLIPILKGFGMNILAYDACPNQSLCEKYDIAYVNLNTLLSQSDVISLHCPLNKDTHHLINRDTIAKMKQDVILVNTSRGALIDTAALIEGLKSGKLYGVGLDVYEEEDAYFFEDKSGEIMYDERLAYLMTFPNVLITSHQAFFTREAMAAIAQVTLKNLQAVVSGADVLENQVKG